jgi:DNA-binding IclR family transcriptional regulator
MDEARIPVAMIARAARVLRAFDEDALVLTLPELARRSGLPTSTVHRIARALADAGLLDRAGSGYSIGQGLWEIGELAPVSSQLRETALPHMMTLYEQTRENVHLAVLDGSEALYVGRVTGTGSIPTLSRMGGRLPLHTTGVGKALLATQTEDWLAAYFRLPRERETSFSVIDEGQLRADIEATRERGWAIARQEMTLGNVSIAAALPQADGRPATAIGVVAHLARTGEDRLGRMVQRAARAIGDDLASH